MVSELQHQASNNNPTLSAQSAARLQGNNTDSSSSSRRSKDDNRDKTTNNDTTLLRRDVKCMVDSMIERVENITKKAVEAARESGTLALSRVTRMEKSSAERVSSLDAQFKSLHHTHTNAFRTLRGKLADMGTTITALVAHQRQQQQQQDHHKPIFLGKEEEEDHHKPIFLGKEEEEEEEGLEERGKESQRIVDSSSSSSRRTTSLSTKESQKKRLLRKSPPSGVGFGGGEADDGSAKGGRKADIQTLRLEEAIALLTKQISSIQSCHRVPPSLPSFRASFHLSTERKKAAPSPSEGGSSRIDSNRRGLERHKKYSNIHPAEVALILRDLESKQRARAQLVEKLRRLEKSVEFFKVGALPEAADARGKRKCVKEDKLGLAGARLDRIFGNHGYNPYP
eukprot:jgi/Bigna1/83481/fgenesh1_pg.109_\